MALFSVFPIIIVIGFLNCATSGKTTSNGLYSLSSNHEWTALNSSRSLRTSLSVPSRHNNSRRLALQDITNEMVKKSQKSSSSAAKEILRVKRKLAKIVTKLLGPNLELLRNGNKTIGSSREGRNGISVLRELAILAQPSILRFGKFFNVVQDTIVDSLTGSMIAVILVKAIISGFLNIIKTIALPILFWVIMLAVLAYGGYLYSRDLDEDADGLGEDGVDDEDDDNDHTLPAGGVDLSVLFSRNGNGYEEVEKPTFINNRLGTVSSTTIKYQGGFNYPKYNDNWKAVVQTKNNELLNTNNNNYYSYQQQNEPFYLNRTHVTKNYVNNDSGYMMYQLPQQYQNYYSSYYPYQQISKY